MAVGSIWAGAPGFVRAGSLNTLNSRRPPRNERKFVSRSVEETIQRVKAKIKDPHLAWMFENCFPNTLDTTVQVGVVDGKLDTFIVTGDIDAMWLRDSSCQVWPYLSLAKDDDDLRRMFCGLIARQSRCILIDPYANAFLFDPHATKPLSWSVGDLTEMRPGVAERKWEIDSLCFCIRLAHGYWRATGDVSPFTAEWARAMQLVVDTFREQQRKEGRGNYHFERKTEVPTDTLMLGGFGNPARPVGLIHSMFRPSDDACLFSLFVPGNLFAVVSLRQLSEMADAVLRDAVFATACRSLASEIESALSEYGRVRQEKGGEIWAYEVDGFGNQIFMDDANLPSLLGLPYLGCCPADDPVYRRTRSRILSSANPYFFKGAAAEGVGGPHIGLDMIWPMSIITRALTSSDASEIRQCLRWLNTTDAGSGFVHEAFHKNDPAQFTRPWFAWANSLFGELIVKVSQEYPEMLG
ncbi:MAG TPA: glycoside hydrolase family 125 protein [Candidatus Sulfotelmatobacter sp.]|nr:glycoside hydrolase family 125 protein [Candidatus Sulfotelmatobacter sp.]